MVCVRLSYRVRVKIINSKVRVRFSIRFRVTVMVMIILFLSTLKFFFKIIIDNFYTKIFVRWPQINF